MLPDHWGGSEELWSKTALDLAIKGVPVAVSMSDWSSMPPLTPNFLQAGVKLQRRPIQNSVIRQVSRKVFPSQRAKSPRDIDIERFLTAANPKLVVLSDGSVLPPLELMELCEKKRLPFVIVGHANFQHWWPNDQDAARLRKVLPKAVRCFFVSKSNQGLVESQLGCKLENAEIVRNPFNVSIDAMPLWPSLEVDGELRLACVARLDPSSKGQDLLFKSLACPAWLARRWRLSLYGDGPAKEGLQRFCARLGLRNRVLFAGHCSSIESVWTENHVLVLPSRWEGMPLAIVEAMICGRPVVATDVGGINEIVEDGVTGFLADAATPHSIQHALDRLWIRRQELEYIGTMAAQRIRKIIPADPVGVFSDRLLRLLCSERVTDELI